MCQQFMRIVDTLGPCIQTLGLYIGLKFRLKISDLPCSLHQAIAGLGPALHGRLPCRTNLPLPRLRDFE